MKTKILSLLIILSLGFASCASFVPDYYKLQINDGTYLKIDKSKTETIYELVVGGKYIFLGTWAELKQALKTFAKDVLQALFEIITKYIFDDESGNGAGVPEDIRFDIMQYK